MVCASRMENSLVFVAVSPGCLGPSCIGPSDDSAIAKFIADSVVLTKPSGADVSLVGLMSLAISLEPIMHVYAFVTLTLAVLIRSRGSSAR